MNTILGTAAPAGGENATLQRALWLRQQGFSVIAVRKDMVMPFKPWSIYCREQRASVEQLHEWFASGKYEIGLACGPAGQTVVVCVNEFLSNWFRREFPDFFAETSRYGQRYFFYWLEDEKFNSAVYVSSAYDIRTKPITVHYSGNWVYAPGAQDSYGWIKTISDVPATYRYYKRCHAFQLEWVRTFEFENRMWRQVFGTPGSGFKGR